MVIANTTDYAACRRRSRRRRAHGRVSDWEHTYDVCGRRARDADHRRDAAQCRHELHVPAVHADTNVHLVGFGATNEQGTAANTHLKEAMAAVIDPVC